MTCSHCLGRVGPFGAVATESQPPYALTPPSLSRSSLVGLTPTTTQWTSQRTSPNHRTSSFYPPTKGSVWSEMVEEAQVLGNVSQGNGNVIPLSRRTAASEFGTQYRGSIASVGFCASSSCTGYQQVGQPGPACDILSQATLSSPDGAPDLDLPLQIGQQAVPGSGPPPAVAALESLLTWREPLNSLRWFAGGMYLLICVQQLGSGEELLMHCLGGREPG